MITLERRHTEGYIKVFIEFVVFAQGAVENIGEIAYVVEVDHRIDVLQKGCMGVHGSLGS